MSPDRNAAARLLLLLLAIASSSVVLAQLAGCHVAPLPDPQTPPGPGPVDPPPSPGPGPAATPCELACAKADELDCDGDHKPDPLCPAACERYEQTGGAFARNPVCQAKASTCQQYSACRSGGP